MKKVLKIVGVIIALLLVIMISIPLLFGGKIESIAKQEANKMLNGEFDFSSLDISLFKNFPKASLTVNNFWVKGVDDFSNDTIVKAKELTATIDIFSLFGDSYEIDRVILKEATLKAVIAENDKVNWDILKESEVTTETSVATEEGGDFALKLNQLTLDDLTILFDNRKDKELMSINHLQLNLKGDLSSEHTTLNITAESPAISYNVNGLALVNNISVKTKINLDADLKNNKFTLNQNEIQLNAIKSSLDGWVALKEDDAIDMDLSINTDKIDFKQILSLIPALYTNDFKGLKTEGQATLNAYAKGTFKGDNLPAFNVKLDIKDASFRYPSLPTGVEQINVFAEVNNPGGTADATKIIINPLALSIAGNPFKVTAEVVHPISDPVFKMTANGILDLGKIKDVYPLEDMELNGTINANLSVAGKSSDIEKEFYEKINASGTVKLTDMVVNTSSLKNLKINQSLLTFTPAYLKLSETKVEFGKNDLTVDSQLQNYIGYFLHGSTIKGSLNVSSNYLNLDDFGMTQEDTATVEETDSVTTAIEIPKNIDFNMNANFKEVVLAKMKFENINGRIALKNGKADMTNLSMNTMGGEIVMNGFYSTQQPKHSLLNANLIMNNLVFAQVYRDLDMVQSLAPIFNSLEGTFSGAMQIKTELNESLEPVYPSLQAAGNLKTKNISLENVKALQDLAKAVKKEDLVNKPLKDLELNFTIKDGRLETKPFEFNLGDYLMTLSGTTGLDQTIDYSGKLKLPNSVAKIDGLNTVGILIGGTFNAPTFKLDTKSMIESGGKALESAAKDFISKELLKNKKDTTATGDKESERDFKEDVKEEVGNKIKDLFKKKKNK